MVRFHFRRFLRIVLSSIQLLAMERPSTIALAKKPDFQRKHSRQVGKEHRFIGVFWPQVGKTMPFLPKDGSEP
ncbi:MAG TPA: hypothetical protein VGF67_06285 [Ktedonobacteraceae bacterium]|jgi:hypothetical protein